MAKWLGNRLLGQALPIITDTADWPANMPGINYAAQGLSIPSYHIVPHGLLHQTGTQPPLLEPGLTQQLPVFFAGTEGHHPFDVLAASFYLLTRYEEYAPQYDLDAYGRYSHTNSVLFKNGWLKRPLVDEWVMHLRERLKEHFPGIQWQPLQPVFTPTYDVDIAWSYLHKGWKRNAGGVLKDLLWGHWHKLWKRAAVLAGRHRDPYARFEQLNQIHIQHHLKAIFFFLVAKKQKGFDKNINRNSIALQNLIQQQAQHAIVGIHGSWAAFEHPENMEEEMAFLQQWIQRPLRANRMHYLKFSLPHTYRHLHALGIQEEYSMGYGTINGFRAGTSHPYYWYCLQDEQETALQIFPFAWMDANSIFEQRDSPEQALEELDLLYQQVRQTGGHFITIAHNHLLAHDAEGQPWWDAYATFLGGMVTGVDA